MVKNKDEHILGKSYIEIEIKDIDKLKNQLKELKDGLLEIYKILQDIKKLFSSNK